MSTPTTRRAALIRAAAKAALRDGILGEMPAGLKISVRAGVDMIWIEISGAPDGWSSEDGPSDSFPFGRRVGSAEACGLAAKLASIAAEQAPGYAVRFLLCPTDGNPVYLRPVDPEGERMARAERADTEG
jgi:hypothetical protein